MTFILRVKTHSNKLICCQKHTEQDLDFHKSQLLLRQQPLLNSSHAESISTSPACGISDSVSLLQAGMGPAGREKAASEESLPGATVKADASQGKSFSVQPVSKKGLDQVCSHPQMER